VFSAIFVEKVANCYYDYTIMAFLSKSYGLIIAETEPCCGSRRFLTDPDPDPTFEYVSDPVLDPDPDLNKFSAKFLLEIFCSGNMLYKG
jgi:hypothetical protein